MNTTPKNSPNVDEPKPEAASPANRPAGGNSGKRRLMLLVLALITVVLLVVPNGLYLIRQNELASPPVTSSPATKLPVTCGDSYQAFADEAFGMAFCYPAEWGDATVRDVKVDPTDTGHRESVVFADNALFAVGGVSEDWSTAVGRDTACLEPNNRPVPLAEYDTNWHGMVGSGMAVEFAMRSLPAGTGGYDITETTSDLLLRGVCAQAHKVIDGSRYRVAFAGFYRDFAPASGITTPRAHMDTPTVLFSETQRLQLTTLLDSLTAY